MNDDKPSAIDPMDDLILRDQLPSSRSQSPECDRCGTLQRKTPNKGHLEEICLLGGITGLRQAKPPKCYVFMTIDFFNEINNIIATVW
jgi:hypothetical protein